MSHPPAPATVVVHAGRPDRVPGGPLNPPVTLSSTYHSGGERVYARMSNPTWDGFEQVLGELEGGPALAFASGMAAACAALELVPAGSTVLVPTRLYNGVSDRLADLAADGRVVRVDTPIHDPAALGAAITEHRPAMVWLESPTNPTLEVCDLRAAADAAHAVGALVVCDSTFATPLLQRPLALGCDVVVHSATKFLAGHSDVLLGAVVTADPDLSTRLHRIRTLTGGVAGTTESWLALRGVRTLALRLQRAQGTALELAQRLSSHAAVSRVRYPGLPTDPGHAVAAGQMSGYGAMLAFETVGTGADAQGVCERVRLWTHATSLGGVESTLERRRQSPAESPEVPETLIRLSVGIEDPEDLWADLAAALAPLTPLPHPNSG